MTRVPRDPRAYAAGALILALLDMEKLDNGPKVILDAMCVRGRPLWEAWAEAQGSLPDDRVLLSRGIKALNEMVSEAIIGDEERRDAVEEMRALLENDGEKGDN